MRKTDRLDLIRRRERRASTTSPIYARDTVGRIDSVGTAIFFAHRGRKFALTASHVIRDNRTRQLFIVGRSEISLNRRFFRSPDESSYDVAFVPLTDEDVAALADATFVTVDDLDLADDCAERLYYIVGCRSDDNDPDEANGEPVAQLSIYAARSAPRGMYEERRMSPADQLLLLFDRRRLADLDGPVDPESPPEGMSGSGVWRIRTDRWSDKLAAIVDSYSDDGGVLYAARFRIVMDSLDAHIERRLV